MHRNLDGSHVTLFNQSYNAILVRNKLNYITLVSADDIPIRGFVGHLEEGGYLPHHHKIYLWAHLNINIEYNDNKVSIFLPESGQ